MKRGEYFEKKKDNIYRVNFVSAIYISNLNFCVKTKEF